jgi:hypothetical protein
MCSYIKDLYTFAAVDLRVEEILTTEIKTLCEAIDDEIERDDVFVNKDSVILPVSKRQMSRDEYMRKKERSIESRDAIKHFDNGRAVDIRSRYPLRALPVEYTTASEKINNIAAPKTVADKIGAMECLRKGMSKDQAPMFVNMQRSAKVQIGAHVIKILNTCLRCPVPDVQVERQYEIYYHARTNEAQLSIDKDRKRAIETQRLKDEKMCPLTITRMPWELIAGDETRATYNTRLRLRLLDALFYCTKMEKAVARERKHKFSREYFSNKYPHCIQVIQ